MWRRLPENIVQEHLQLWEQKKGMPRIARGILATVLFVAALFGISHLNQFFSGTPVQGNSGYALNLQNASAMTLVLVFLATIAFMYFLLVKNRKPPVIFICYSCQEPFHAQATCPACNSADISDIRFAEWVEESEKTP